MKNSNLLKRFIQFNTVTSKSNANLAYEVGRVLRRGGFRVTYQKEKIKGQLFVNVIGLKGGSGGHMGPPLLLCSHLDTVSAGHLEKWTKTGGNPWKAAVRGGRLYGLGAADDKGPLAAMLEAALNFPQAKLKRPLVVMGTYGEESGMGGAKLFTRSWKGPKPCMAIVGEPTNLGITYRHKGVGVIEIELLFPRDAGAKRAPSPQKMVFMGRSGHSSRPWLGDNALDKAARFLKSVSRRGGTARRPCIASLDGGHAANIIPDKAVVVLTNAPAFPADAFLDCYDAVQSLVKKMQKRKDASFHPQTLTSNFGIAETDKNTLKLTFDFRLLPGQSTQRIFTVLKKQLAKKISNYPGLRFKIKIERDNPPLVADREDPLPQLACRLLRENNLPAEMSVKPACTEAGIYAAWGVPAVIFGPGRSESNIHAPNECIEIGQIRKAVKFYSSVIRKVCF